MNRTSRTRQNRQQSKPFWGRLFHGPRPTPETQLHRSRRNTLSFEMLEDRITPESRTFGSLFFDAGANPLASSGVNVSLGQGQPTLLRFDQGVSFGGDGDSFSTPGIVRAMGNGTFIPLLGQSSHSFKTSNLTGSGNDVTGGTPVTILGSAITPTNIKFISVGTPAAPVVDIKGTIGFAGFDGLSIAIPDGATAQIGASGARYAKDFSATLKDKEFKLKKIQVNTSDVTIGYEQSSQTFYLDGAAKVSNVVTGTDASGKTKKKTFELASAQLGDGTKHGIVISSSGLESAHIKVNANIDLKGLKLIADNLTIGYSAANSQLEFSGGVTVQLNSSISFGAALTIPVAIDTNTGDVSIPNGLGIKGSLQIGNFGAAADIKYVPDGAGNYTLDADVEIDLRGFKIGGTFTLVNSTLTSIGLSYNAGMSAGIPMGSTGLNIKSFAGQVNNLDNTSKIEVTAASVSPSAKRSQSSARNTPSSMPPRASRSRRIPYTSAARSTLSAASSAPASVRLTSIGIKGSTASPSMPSFWKCSASPARSRSTTPGILR
ncbi:hypothetical protein BH11PLA2_BH11PLA2_24970 [soil metagenome]